MSTSTKRLSEKAVQDALEVHFKAKGWSVKREVSTPVGYIDLLVWKPDGTKLLIEVKERAGLKGAVGQVEMYSKYQPCDRKIIIYFTYTGVHKPVDVTYNQLPGIEIYSIHQYIDIDTLLPYQIPYQTPCPTLPIHRYHPLNETSNNSILNEPLTDKMLELPLVASQTKTFLAPVNHPHHHLLQEESLTMRD